MKIVQLAILFLFLSGVASAHLGETHSDFTFSPDDESFLLPTDHVPNFCKNPTIQSIGDGDWSNPNIWNVGRVPTDNDVVRITNGNTIRYDVSFSPDFNCVGIDGKLQFLPNAFTELRTINLMIYQDGELQVGTEAQPVTGRAEIVFRDVSPDTTDDGIGIFDPQQYGTGMQNMGKLRVHGRLLQNTFSRLAQEPRAGDTELVLEESVNDWRIGDKIILPDTRAKKIDNEQFPIESHNEELVVASAAGNRIILTQPLQFDHLGARNADGVTEYLPHVGNLGRTVVFRSENPEGARGHIIHLRYNGHPDVRYALFQDLGRTTIEKLDSTSFDRDNNLENIGTNQIGRYMFHLHHIIGPSGLPPGSPQFVVTGNAFDGGEKWGIAIHDSSFGLVNKNVVYNVEGAGIATEDGNEVYNTIEENFVAVNRGSGGHIYSRSRSRDFGHQGVGFWFQGPLNYVKNNVATNSRLAGFGYVHIDVPKKSRNFGESHTVRIPTFAGADVLIDGEYRLVDVNNEAILLFENNEAYGNMDNAVELWEVGGRRLSGEAIAEGSYHQTTPQSIVKNFLGWHFYYDGVKMRLVNNILIDGLVLRGTHQRSRANGFASRNRMNRNIHILNANIQGLRVGIPVPVTDALTNAVSIDPNNPPFVGTKPFIIENSHLRNYKNIVVPTIAASAGPAEFKPPREAIVKNTELIPYNFVVRPERVSGVNIDMDYRGNRNLIQDSIVKVYDHQGVPGQNFQLFYKEQHPDFVVPQSDDRTTGSPVAGLTNQENMDQFGIAIAGGIAPCFDETSHPDINGFACPLSDAPPVFDPVQPPTESPVQPQLPVTPPVEDPTHSNRITYLSEDFNDPLWYQDWLGQDQLNKLASGRKSLISFFNGELIDAPDAFGFQPLDEKALRIVIEEGQKVGANINFKFTEHGFEEPEELYARYYIRFGNDWQPATNGKLPGPAGRYGQAGWGGRRARGDNGWSARWGFRMKQDGKTPLNAYIYHMDTQRGYGEVCILSDAYTVEETAGTHTDCLKPTWTSDWHIRRGHPLWEWGQDDYLEENRWYCVEQRVKLNTPGAYDGIVQSWINGDVELDKHDFRFRSVDTLKTEEYWFNIYHGGTTPAPQDMHVYIDGVEVSSERIGCSIPIPHEVVTDESDDSTDDDNSPEDDQGSGSPANNGPNDQDTNDQTEELCSDSLGCDILASNGVNKPQNLLTESGFSVLNFVDNAVCPDGSEVRRGNFCRVNLANGKQSKFRSWVIVDFDTQADELTFQLSNEDDGCQGDGCDRSIPVHIFVTNNYAGESTQWEKISGSRISVGRTKTVRRDVTGFIDAVLVTRDIHGDHIGDPRVHWVQLS